MFVSSIAVSFHDVVNVTCFKEEIFLFHSYNQRGIYWTVQNTNTILIHTNTINTNDGIRLCIKILYPFLLIDFMTRLMNSWENYSKKNYDEKRFSGFTNPLERKTILIIYCSSSLACRLNITVSSTFQHCGMNNSKCVQLAHKTNKWKKYIYIYNGTKLFKFLFLLVAFSRTLLSTQICHQFLVFAHFDHYRSANIPSLLMCYLIWFSFHFTLFPLLLNFVTKWVFFFFFYLFSEVSSVKVCFYFSYCK